MTRGWSDRSLTGNAAPIIVGSVSLVVIVGVWKFVGRQEGVALTSVMPPPSVFLASIAENNFRIGLGSRAGSIFESVSSTLFRVFAGMAVAFGLAVITGAVLSLSRIATWILSPVIYLLAPIAPIAWIPIAIVVFGIGNVTAIFIVFMGVYFILTIATLAEIKRLPEEFHIVAQNLGASAFQRWFYVVVPAVLPGVFVLLRTNFLAAWMAVLVAEMVGLRDGLGAIIMMGRNLFNSELIMFGMLTIGICGFVVDKLLQLIGRSLLWWRV